MILPFCHRQTHHTRQPPKMAEMLLYGSLPYNGFWPLLGQKSCYEKCDRFKMAWARAQYGWMALLSATVWSFPGVPTRQVMFIAFTHHHHRNWWWYDWKTTQQSTTFRSPMENERENGWWGGRAQWIGVVTPKICPTKIKRQNLFYL